MDPVTIGLILGGGVLGGLGGMSAADQQAANARAAQAKYGEIKNNIGGYDYRTGQGTGQVGNMVGALNSYYDPVTRNAGQDIQNYRDLANEDLSRFNYDPTNPFQYDLNAKTKSFLDPSMDFQIGEATRAVEGSAANAGQLFSSATGKGIADRSQEIAKQSWKDALATALQDRTFMAGEDQRNITNSRAAKDQGFNMWNTQAGIKGNLSQQGANGLMNQGNAVTAAMGQGYEGMNNADIAMANAIMGSGPGAGAGFLQGFGTGAGAMAPVFKAMNGGNLNG